MKYTQWQKLRWLDDIGLDLYLIGLVTGFMFGIVATFWLISL